MINQVTDTNFRIKWIDTFKGIMIVLVVIGHATGLFNSWIYQFHMAAFFFISGYLSDIENKNGSKDIFKKFVSILFPYFFFAIASFFINELLNTWGMYEKIVGTPYLGFFSSIKALLKRGDIYSQYLGTFWFLSTLFGVEILHMFLISICNKNKYIYLLCSSVLYFCGFYLSFTKVDCRISIFNVSIILVAQIYYCIGVLIGRLNISNDYLGNNLFGHVFCFGAAVGLSLYGLKNGIVMDLASMYVTHPLQELIVACASIIIVVYISHILVRIKTEKIFMILGKNSLGIMIFHFVIFKMCFIFYWKIGWLDFKYISSVVLPVGSSEKLWVPMTVISIFISLLLWVCLKKIPILNILIGQNKQWNNKVAEFIQNRIMLKKHSYENKKFCTKSNRIELMGILFLVIIISIPYFRTGVIINDELQARCLSLQGFVNFYKTNFYSYLNDGRPLAAIVNSFTMYLGFLGNGDTYIFKFFQILILIGEGIAFGFLTSKIIGNNKYGLLAFILCFGFLPIVFEHMSPNAFVGLLGIPLFMLLVSLNLYIVSIEKNDSKLLILSMLLFFISQMSYESLVTYCPLYLVLALSRVGYKNMRKYKVYFFLPLITAFLYLAVYVICGKIFLSGYEGNQIGFVSFASSLKIIGWLFIACIPGFFLIFPRYQYLKELYDSMGFSDYVWLTVSVLLFITVIIFLFHNFESDKRINNNRISKKSIYIIVCALLYMILPSLPISISAMYQGNVGTKGFLVLPITHYEYLAAIFFITYIIYIVNQMISKKFYVIVSIVLAILFCGIQQMNIIFSKEMSKNYNRLLIIEDFLRTNIVRELSGGVYCCPDLYIQQNALAIHDGYWTEYCSNNCGISLQLCKENNDNVCGHIYYDSDNFVIINNENIFVVSSDIEKDTKAIKINDNEYLLFDFYDYDVDNGFYVYTTDASGVIKVDSVGYKKISGIFDDGWLSPNSEFEIHTGDIGTLELEFYYPFEDYTSKDMIVNISVDGKITNTIEIDEQMESVVIQTEKNTVVNLNIDCNFVIEKKNSDIRDLSIVLVGIEVK